MKIKDIAEWSARWSTPRGTMDANAPVADGVLVDLNLWGTSIIGLAVQCPDGNISGASERRGRDTIVALGFQGAPTGGHSAKSWMPRLKIQVRRGHVSEKNFSSR